MPKRAVPAIPYLIGIFGDNTKLGRPGRTGMGVSFTTLTSPGTEAADTIIKIGKPAVKPLISVLRDEDPDVRMRAAMCLGKIRDSRAVDPLIVALKDKDPYVREMVAGAFEYIKNGRAVESLIAALKDDYADVRVKVARALGEQNNIRAVEPLIAALKDEESSNAREQILYWLSALGDIIGDIKDDRTIKPLIEALKDENSQIREMSAHVLGKMKNPCTVGPLIVALKDTDYGVRESAAGALGKIGDTRAVKPLIAALKDEYSDFIGRHPVRREAGRSLQTITRHDFGRNQFYDHGKDYAKWQEWWNKNKDEMLKSR